MTTRAVRAQFVKSDTCENLREAAEDALVPKFTLSQETLDAAREVAHVLLRELRQVDNFARRDSEDDEVQDWGGALPTHTCLQGLQLIQIQLYRSDGDTVIGSEFARPLFAHMDRVHARENGGSHDR